MEEITKVNNGECYYTAMPEMLAAYADMELKENL